MSLSIKKTMAGKVMARSSKRGFTLTEIAIVLGIMGLILGAVWSAASSVYENMKASEAISGITQAVNTVRSQYNNSLDTAVNNAAITVPGMLPVAWGTTTAGVYGNPWVKAPGTTGVAEIYGSSSVVTIALDKVSNAGCASLLNNFSAKSAQTAGGMIVGLISTKKGAAGLSNVSAPQTAGTYAAATTCTSGVLANSVGISFDLTKM